MPHTYFPTASSALKTRGRSSSQASGNREGGIHSHHPPSLFSDPLNKQKTNVSYHHPHWMNKTDSRGPQLQAQDHDAQQAGAEPGVNPRRESAIAEFSHFKQSCVIDVVDYDNKDVTFTRMGNGQLIKLMQLQHRQGGEEEGSEEQDGDLPPRAVRWINIGGIDWSVLSAVALRYNLHSLALEDILHERGHNHSKADYYAGHLFIRILCHSLELENASALYQDIHMNQMEPSEPLFKYPTALSPSAVERGEVPLGKTLVATSDGQDTVHPTISGALTSGVNVLTKNIPSDMNFYSTLEDSPPSTPKVPEELGTNTFENTRLGLRKRLNALSGFNNPVRQEQIIRLKELKKGDRIETKHEPMFIFLLRDGTVISLHPTPNLDYTCPIAERLHEPDSVLRISEDPSLLVESLLDLVVDRVLEMMDEYQVKIHDLEHKILMNPSMNTVRSLHILSGDLIMHKRTLEPIRTMIYGLRKYDLDRCVALADYLALDAEEQVERAESRHGKSTSRGNEKGERQDNNQGERGRDRLKGGEIGREVEGQANSGVLPTQGGYKLRNDDDHVKEMRKVERSRRVEGYFSYKAKVYLADVYDHMDFALTSLDMFSGITENLINYAFNTASYDMNKVMNRLTLATIIFLPLTLLTGYFGMNFVSFWSVNHNSDYFFWKVALPVMVVLVPIFMIDDIRRAVLYIKRKAQDRMVIQELKRKAQKNGSADAKRV